ncbi:UDP-N-acetylmuramate dehydrogenase [Halomonas sp. MCCC 1A17488]|uniref:UDP-N-acetylenolpyruvoylglucosamine reductase n=1 Tax=Billgrantia sulfidoxydans TaxID=2733484 RepID=A0ABX7W4C0_9GAMM|nr:MULTISPECIES: UDP-N-acetylmuramate dehydrogenase [Halomonas]MCE8015673.1 UDP-N-acetylmuramate dehydrogenase [Halomonas sp. MCCC 1A17488]MCG3239006.1 UDP-N-acetylmuramate dehydrogenase [Halomonas sp. MCCC 1A17488]QPP51043.1 UDP-N-acetylmuramate dehydrogenase [Halomonas sp. SS10-MC5]QTP54555.1 UDP-N-acetylmuramate dehydrogenase [Halomonas sulfidoxydans]
MSDTLLADYDLSSANTLGLPCRAERFAAPAALEPLRRWLRLASARAWPLTVLGGGSNLILPERLPGLVLQPALRYWWLERRGDNVLVHVGAGVEWHPLVMALAGRELWGTENLALIPGSCGAAPIQNIGAYGVELCEVLEAVDVMFVEDGRCARLTVEECAFGYRDSIFKGELESKAIVTGLTLRLSREPQPRLGYGDLAQRVGRHPGPLEVAEAVCAIRREKLPDPAVLGNAGSFFKNPIVERKQAAQLLATWPDMPLFELPDGRAKLAAGWLIDRCGLKGWRAGHFGVHERQALVLVHFGGGSAGELLAVAERIVERVQARFGVSLEREPRLA